MEACHLLICDDEWMIREQLARCARDVGGFLLHTASSGLEALEILAQYPIDGMVLDVRMPEMDGITLLQQMRVQHKDPVVIILSGHDEFHYAQECLHYGAVEYLLKPVTEQQIREFLVEMKERVRRKQDYAARLDSYRKELDNIRPLLREQFFRELLQNHPGPERVHHIEQFLGLRVQFPVVVVAVVNLRPTGDPSGGCDPLQRYAVGELLEAQLPAQLNASLFHMDGDVMTILAGGEGESVALQLSNALERVLDTLAGDLGMRFYAGVGGLVHGVEQIRNSYAQAIYALSCNDFSQETGIVGIGDVEDQDSREIDRRNLQASLRELLAVSPTTDIQEVFSRLRDFLDRLRLCSDIDLNAAIYYCSALCVVALDRLELRQEFLNRNPIHEICSKTTPEELYRTTASLLDSILKTVQSTKQSHLHRLADACRAVIERDYRNKIGIQEIADQLNVSRNYLSTVFRKETDYSVIEYLNIVRLQHAKRLLRDTNLKIYEIADQVGFSDTYYFSSVFKKQTGVSPSEYRDSMA